MTSENLYKNIAARTGGDIYIGVVGPVRTGKSTFIKRTFEKLIIPDMPHGADLDRMIDELPQSSAGRTIMTTEPKFVPEKAVQIELEQKLNVRIRMVDCVGFIVPSSLGYFEDEAPRMVKTPWFDDEIPFNMAAEIGTQKVITDHSTIGIVVTSDGSINDIPREEYEEAEERVINELKQLKKPFVVLLNCVYPDSVAAKSMSEELSAKYNVPVLAVNCLELETEEIKTILSTVLYEFPISRIDIRCPSWFAGLSAEHGYKAEFAAYLKKNVQDIFCLRHVENFAKTMENCRNVTDVRTLELDPSCGRAAIAVKLSDSLFYEQVSEVAGMEIRTDSGLINTLRELALLKKKYEKFETALKEVDSTGYGIVMPGIDELTLEEPEIMKQGGKYGVRLKASAPSIHMMRADITTEVAPIVGSEKQSEDLIMYLLKEFEESPSKIWESNIFGTSLNELVNEGLRSKLMHMPHEARMKLQQTLERIINEGCSGLICIII
ncbi:MAG: stage IV sporulation protein A [Clostridia bacterium]|nr:stage IV sporulation protein A [Clostridia bacterium]